MKNDSARRVYVVVDVAAGVAVDAQCFSRLEAALACTRSLRKGRNLQEDDVRVIRTVLKA